MLAVFRNNHTTTLFILAIYVAALRLPAILGWLPAPVELSETDGGLLFWDLFGSIAVNRQYSAIAAAVLVFIQALTINFLTDRNRMLDQRNWYPGALYALASSLLPEFSVLTPTLVAATFIPFALFQIFGIYKQFQFVGSVFDSAFWISVAVLFHPPAVWCLPAAYVGLLSLRQLSARRQVVFFTGIFVPIFLAFAAYFWYDRAGSFVDTQFSRWIYWPSFRSEAGFYHTMKLVLLGVLFAVVLLGFNVYYFRRLIQVQKFITILYWFFFAGLAAALFHREFRFDYFLLAMPAVGMFLAFLGQSIRNTGLVDFLHLLLLAAVYYVQFYPVIS